MLKFANDPLLLKSFVREAFDVEYAAVLGAASDDRIGLLSALILKAGRFDESEHPRGDDGRFIGREVIHEAKSDPAKADALRAKTTDPEQRKKLDAALGGETDLGRTKAGLHREKVQQSKAEKKATVDKVRQLANDISTARRGGEPVSSEHYKELAAHLPQLTIQELRSVRGKLAASFGGSTRRDEMVAKLLAHAKQKAELLHAAESYGDTDPLDFGAFDTYEGNSVSAKAPGGEERDTTHADRMAQRHAVENAVEGPVKVADTGRSLADKGSPLAVAKKVPDEALTEHLNRKEGGDELRPAGPGSDSGLVGDKGGLPGTSEDEPRDGQVRPAAEGTPPAEQGKPRATEPARSDAVAGGVEPKTAPHSPAEATASIKDILHKIRGYDIDQGEVKASLDKLDSMSAPHLLEVANSIDAGTGLTLKSPKAKILKQVKEMVVRAQKSVLHAIEGQQGKTYDERLAQHRKQVGYAPAADKPKPLPPLKAKPVDTRPYGQRDTADDHEMTGVNPRGTQNNLPQTGNNTSTTVDSSAGKADTVPVEPQPAALKQESKMDIAKKTRKPKSAPVPKPNAEGSKKVWADFQSSQGTAKRALDAVLHNAGIRDASGMKDEPEIDQKELAVELHRALNIPLHADRLAPAHNALVRALAHIDPEEAAKYPIRPDDYAPPERGYQDHVFDPELFRQYRQRSEAAAARGRAFDRSGWDS